MRKALFTFVTFFLLFCTNLYADNELDLLVKKASENVSHVTLWTYQDKKVWFKRTDGKKKNGWVCVKKYFSEFIPFKILQPTIYCGSQTALQHEKKRIAELTQAKILVPEIIASDEDWVILSDMGKSLDNVVSKASPVEKMNLLKKAAHSLGDMHRKRQWHGRGHIKDMTLLGNDIAFIDFEENPLENLSLATSQARDILMFCYSIMSLIDNDSQKLKIILDTYKKRAPKDAWLEVKRNNKLFKPFMIMCAPFSQYLGKDLQRAIKTSQALDEVLKNDHL